MDKQQIMKICKRGGMTYVFIAFVLAIYSSFYLGQKSGEAGVYRDYYAFPKNSEYVDQMIAVQHNDDGTYSNAEVVNAGSLEGAYAIRPGENQSYIPLFKDPKDVKGIHGQ